MASTNPDPVLREYTALATTYDRRWSRYVHASVRETVRRAPLTSGMRILDVGCGTGALLANLEQNASDCHLVGVDPCQPMLKVARSRTSARVTFVVATANHLPLADASFDLVVSTSAFHYFPHPIESLHEMRRVLVPGGRLVITDWCHDYLTCRICDGVLRRLRRSYHQCYSVAECWELLAAAGFESIAIDRYRISWLWGLMTAQAVAPAR